MSSPFALSLFGSDVGRQIDDAIVDQTGNPRVSVSSVESAIGAGSVRLPFGFPQRASLKDPYQSS